VVALLTVRQTRAAARGGGSAPWSAGMLLMAVPRMFGVLGGDLNLSGRRELTLARRRAGARAVCRSRWQTRSVAAGGWTPRRVGAAGWRRVRADGVDRPVSFFRAVVGGDWGYERTKSPHFIFEGGDCP